MNVIRNVRLSPDGLGLLTEDHIRILLVDIHGNTCHAGNCLQLLHKHILCRKFPAVNDKAYHDLFCRKTIADQCVAHKPSSGFLIVGFYVALTHIG